MNKEAMTKELVAERIGATFNIDLLPGLIRDLETSLRIEGCSHNHKLATRYLEDHGVQDVKPILQWLRDNGGYCDCEIMLNVPYNFERKLTEV